MEISAKIATANKSLMTWFRKGASHDSGTLIFSLMHVIELVDHTAIRPASETLQDSAFNGSVQSKQLVYCNGAEECRQKRRRHAQRADTQKISKADVQ